MSLYRRIEGRFTVCEHHVAWSTLFVFFSTVLAASAFMRRGTIVRKRARHRKYSLKYSILVYYDGKKTLVARASCIPTPSNAQDARVTPMNKDSSTSLPRNKQRADREVTPVNLDIPAATSRSDACQSGCTCRNAPQ